VFANASKKVQRGGERGTAPSSQIERALDSLAKKKFSSTGRGKNAKKKKKKQIVDPQPKGQNWEPAPSHHIAQKDRTKNQTGWLCVDSRRQNRWEVLEKRVTENQKRIG